MSTRLDRTYVTQVRTLRDRVEAFARQRFTAGQYRDDDMAAFLRTVVPVVLAAQRTISALTDAWLSQTLTEALGRVVRPSGPIDVSALRGVGPAEVYTRPFKTVRYELSQDKPLDKAIDVGLKRTTDLVATDAQLAKTHTARATFQRAGVERFRRALTGDVNCAMCYVASTQPYSTKNLLPIHPGCDCGVAPIEGDFDEDATLAAPHQAMQERFGVSDASGRAIDYRKALLVREHGEIGPVLTVESHRFTSERDLS